MPSKDGTAAEGKQKRHPTASTLVGPCRMGRDPESSSTKDAWLGAKRAHVNASRVLLLASALANALGTKTLTGSHSG